MFAYIVRRLIQCAIVLFIVTVIIFITIRLLPGDPLLMLISQTESEEFTQAQLAALREQFGLNKPLIVQYFDWAGDILRGDLGRSIVSKLPVHQEILRRIPITLHIGILSFLLSIIIGIPAGIICAVKRSTWIDNVVTTLANLGITVPNFWLGILMIYLFALYLGWLPTMGYTSPFKDFWLSTRMLIMPVFCMMVGAVSMNTRQVRSAMLEVLHQDYIRTAWSKGLRFRIVIFKHALRNAIVPIVTLIGMGIPMLLGGAVLIEQVFSIPGMGRLAIDAINRQDYPYVQAISLIMASAVVFSNLAVDLAYGWIDPRIKYG
ncbi:MAG: ABC transporter permease [candidate division KSB1 bacterium]|nr:ABC transporter permease [candidate division KSB1 bacterium]